MLSQLQLDLRELSQEARKKEAELKEASENATLLVRTLAEKTKDMNEQVKRTSPCRFLSHKLSKNLASYLPELQTMDDVLKPFLLGLALSGSSQKIGLISISGINKLISYHALHEVDSGAMNDMTSLLKVMQTIVAMLTPPSPPIHADDLAKALGLCLKMHASKTPGLHQPSEASLRQIFSTIMDTTWSLYSKQQQQLQQSQTDLSSLSQQSVISTTTDSSSDPSSSLEPSLSHVLSSSSTSALSNAQQDSSHVVSTKQKQSECDRCILDATRLLRDIVYLAGGNQPIWLSVTSLDPNFCLELIEEFLTTHKHLALQCPEFMSIVKDRIGVLLLQLLEHRRDIGFMIRLLRTCVAFMTTFYLQQSMNCVTILGAFKSYLLPTQPFWLQVLVLEAFKWLCKDGEALFSQLIEKDDSALKEKPQMLEAFMKLIGKLGRYVTTSIAKLDPQEFVAKTMKPRFIDQLTYTDISGQMAPSHAISLSLSCFVTLTDALAHLVTPFGLTPGSATASPTGIESPLVKTDSSSSISSQRSSISLDVPSSLAKNPATSTSLPPSQEHLDALFQACQKVCDASWPSVLASLSVILSKTRDDSLIHSSLKAYQSFTNTLGLLKLSGPRGALLESLVKFALPFGSSPSPANSSSAGITTSSSTIITTLLSEEEYRNCRFTKKNIAAMKTVLNVAHCMGSILDTNWTIMVETLNHLNGILACTRRVRNVGVITGVVSSPSDDDLSFSSSSVDSIGSSGGINSKGKPSHGAISQYELNTQDASLAAQEWPTREEIDILDSALESLFSTSIYISDTGLVDFANSLISMSNAQLEAITENMNVRPHALYGPTALLKLARNNLHRASLIWTSIHKHILEACSSPNHFTRQFVLKSACSAIEEGVHAISKPPYDSLAKDDPSFVSMMLMQVRFLETIEALVECRYDHVRIETLESMHRILQNSGVALNSGWHVVLAILLNIGVSNEISLIPLGFKSVQSITNEYLSALPFECLPVTISTIGNFGGKSIADININIAAIGLLWNVADFIARKQHDILKELHSAGEDITTPSRPDTPLVGSPSEVPFRHNDAQFSAGSGGLYKGQATYVDSLWLALFQELAARVDNLRCEIRDCALATLYGILTTYGSSLNLPAWQNLLEKLLLPSFPWVLKQVEAAGRAIDDAETQQSMISTTNLQQSTTTTSTAKATQPSSGGHPSTIHRNNSQTSPHLSANSAAQIVIHPARNTLVKQWQETQVSLLANMSRVFKAFLKSALVKLPISTLERCYTTFLDHAEIFAKSSNLDVAQQAVSSVRELLVATYNFFEDFKPSSANEAISSPFNGASLPDACIQLTNHAWRTWQRIANSIGKNRQQARLVGHFVEGIEELHAVLQRKNCDFIHIQRILSVLEPLLYLPLELAGEYTVLHRQVFPLLSSLVLPSHSPKAATMISPGSNTTSAANGPTSLALQSRHALEIVPQVVSICLTYISNAIGFQYKPACYTPESPALRHQLDLPNLKPSEATVITTPPSALSMPPPPHPSPPPTSSPFVVDRGSWNVSQASLEKNFFNLADKSVRLLVALWECLVKRDYILKQSPSSASTDSDSALLSTDQEVENQRVEAECLRLSIQVFPDLASVLGYAIQVRNLDNRAKFWTPCLELFTSVVREALPWLSPESSSLASIPSSSAASSSNAIDGSTATTTPALDSSTVANKKTFSNIDKNIIWTGVIDSIESFLMASVDGSNALSVPSSTSLHHPMMAMPPSPAPDSPEAIAAQASEARLIELLTSHLIYICPNLPNLHDRLFQILTDGCELNQRESMMKQCYSGLFDTVHQVSLMDQTTSTLQGNPFKTRENCIRVARLAFPQLMRRCRGVISKFVADDKRSGALPLPSSRISEISFVLEQLRTLRVDSSLWDKPPKVAHLATSQIRHLWELFPLLCECITAKETTVKLLVKSLFLECGLELGLE